MARKLKDSVAVVTGASSGIGRATAIALAKKGARVAVASRRADALTALVGEIERDGGTAIAVPTDITDTRAVEALANATLEAFGRIDIWVNDAAVMSFGRFIDTPIEVFDRVIQTNVLGTANGARVALPIFREQGSGTLVNVASIVSRFPQPHAAAYVASKHAVRALGMNLRQELQIDGVDDVHIVTILPATIDTPLFQQAANYTGKKIRPPSPVYSAEQVAETILDGIRHPKPEIVAGSAGHGMTLAGRLMPNATARFATTLASQQVVEGTHVPSTPGNVFEPSTEEPRVSGGWGPDASSVTRKVALAGAALAAIPLARRATNRLRGSRR